MIGNKFSLVGGFAFAALLITAQAARATFSIATSSTDPATGEYQYSISFVTNSSGTVNNGQGFVIYDFPNLVTTGPDAPSLTDLTGFANNLTLSQQLLGNAVSSGLNTLVAVNGYTDNPNVENLSFVYNSSSPYSEPSAGATGILTLFTSDANVVNITGAAASQDTETGNQNVYNGITVPSPVPEPTTLGILGLTGAALLGRRRKTA
jgi:hypothetical protein